MSIDIKLNIANAISGFSKGNLFNNAIQLFNTLGYNTERQTRLHTTTFASFKENFIEPGSAFNEEKALVKDWNYVDLLFQLSAGEMQKQESLFKPTIERNEPASYLFFSVELDGKIYTRNQLSEITREINKLFRMHVFVVFKYGQYLSLSLIDRRANKKVIDKDVMEKVTHVFNISVSKPHSAHIQILYTFSFNAIAAESRKKRIESFNDLQTGWRKVISTDILNKQFYLDYSKLSVKLINAIYPVQVKNKLVAHQGVLNLLNRIMFIYFVQKKEWIMNDENFIIHFWNNYTESKQENNFHQHWLNTIFFNAFNGKAWQAHKSLKYLPTAIQNELANFPYLNGGLYAFNSDHDNFILPDNLFKEIFHFFESYIFTIAEDTPYDVNLEISPELLGKMYEGMINATDLNDVDAENGIIYTERPEINFMTRRSFVEVLDKKLNGSLSREFLYHFVFDEPGQKYEVLKRYKVNTKNLRDSILSITVCDPACGSGSLLLGVIQLQMELLRVLDAYENKPHTPKDDFDIKKQLISECIYGVDIKEWAVRIAELRLWLYMIAEAEFTKEELVKKPLLPNLDFKLRCGNSLLQKFGGLNFTIEDIFKGKRKTSGAAKQLNDYIKKKKAFILNQAEADTTYEKLKQEESAVFRDLIREMITEKEILVKNKAKQTSLFATATQKEMFEGETAAIQKEIVQLKKLRDFIRDEKRLPFSYDIDFMEVFLAKENDPGFDLIIGNPPYVRQEQILPPEDGEYLEYLLLSENKDEKAKVNKAYKEELNDKVYKTFPFLSTTIKTTIDGKNRTVPVYGSKVPGRSDLYCYFQLLCPAYLNSKGTFCYIISNSWLDVDFGSYVQHFLLKHTNLYAVYDCNVRSFDAKVNTIVYLHSALQNTSEKRDGFYKTLQPVDNTVQFVMNKIDYIEAAYAPLLLEQEHCHKNTFKDLYRVITLTQKELYAAGYDDEQVQHTGDKWGGKYLRAPEIYYTILKKGKHKLVRLGDVADVRFGIKTGANEFFYLDQVAIDKWDIEEEFLVPVFKGPKDSKTIQIYRKDLSLNLFYCHKTRKELNGTNALKYIQWGEREKFNERPSCKGRTNWYDVGVREISLGVFPSGFGEIFRFFLNKKFLIDKRLYEIYTHDENVLAVLNSSLTPFMMEVNSRTGLGDGLLDYTVYEAKNVLIADFAKKQKIEYNFKREIQNIFLELGFDKTQPIREQQPNPLPDRKELDDIIFDEIGLTNDERNEIYWSVAELVQQRINKAASR